MSAETRHERVASGPAAILAVHSRDITNAEAEYIVRQRYGFNSTATPLRSERDQNFLVTSTDGQQSVLKLSNASQDERLCWFQTRALLHIASVAPSLPVPRVLPTLDGESRFWWNDGETDRRTGFMLEFLRGVPVAELPQTPALAARTGKLTANLGRALRGFFDPAADHELLWDLKQASHLTEYLPFIQDDRNRDLSRAAIDRFRSHVEHRLPALRGQVIHNDLNPHNILADPSHPETPSGIIDFGDMVFGALINDVAVAAAYLITPENDPFALVATFVAAYHAITPFEPDELDLLPDLIATRYAMSCAITDWRAARYPENAPYIRRNSKGAVLGLRTLADHGRETLARRLAEACELRAGK
ncbi:phosphotransferase [Lichenifustis flavocetrariae]|uniref:Hydroxylysine kinase n=1 Tax=Lichenifustis flavocetrariae TaxID=2949735 RepID=A0AA41Z0L1_9HYPH|nr:phosphotransferase [Lichenifustis flavocetrariae]MCW6511976.1 phosphotransferase [Lichenifustis flavocetrariae]